VLAATRGTRHMTTSREAPPLARGTAALVAPRRGRGRGTVHSGGGWARSAGCGRGTVRRDSDKSVARRRGSLGQANDGAAHRDERSESGELEICSLS
jgi:hypothetical protein